MAGMPNPGLLSVRPALTRTRSNTSPLTPSNLSIETSALAPQESHRPVHNRSKSYISPTEIKPASSNILSGPVERPLESSKFTRLHLPGKHHQAQADEPKVQPHKKHRFMQSESQQYHRKHVSAKAQEISNTTTSHHGIPPDILYPGSRGAAIPSLMRMRSYRSYRGPPHASEGNESRNQGSSRARANSDPKSPTQPSTSSTTKSAVELQLEKGDLLRYAAHQNVNREDIDRLSKRLDSARGELQARFAADTSTASGFMERLDHVHDTLHRTTESLVDTLSSFSSLAQQSTRLLSNFETETANLNSSLKSRIRRLRSEICTKRADRVSELEKRGKAVGQKAEDLGRRLENCRTIVKNWETRETKKRRTWKGVRDGILWGLLLILIGVIAGILSWKAVQFSDGQGTPEQVLGSLVKNESWKPDSLASANIPEDVRRVLQDIVARERDGVVRGQGYRGGGRPKHPEDIKEDKRVRLLDEL